MEEESVEDQACGGDTDAGKATHRDESPKQWFFSPPTHPTRWTPLNATCDEQLTTFYEHHVLEWWGGQVTEVEMRGSMHTASLIQREIRSRAVNETTYDIKLAFLVLPSKVVRIEYVYSDNETSFLWAWKGLSNVYPHQRDMQYLRGVDLHDMPCSSRNISCMLGSGVLRSMALSESPTCPTCRHVFRTLGCQPSGVMLVHLNRDTHTWGRSRIGTLVVSFTFNAGIQGDRMRAPGTPYVEATFETEFQDDRGGHQGIRILEQAFRQGLLFRIAAGVIKCNVDLEERSFATLRRQCMMAGVQVIDNIRDSQCDSLLVFGEEFDPDDDGIHGCESNDVSTDAGASGDRSKLERRERRRKQKRDYMRRVRAVRKAKRAEWRRKQEERRRQDYLGVPGAIQEGMHVQGERRSVDADEQHVAAWFQAVKRDSAQNPESHKRLSAAEIKALRERLFSAGHVARSTAGQRGETASSLLASFEASSTPRTLSQTELHRRDQQPNINGTVRGTRDRTVQMRQNNASQAGIVESTNVQDETGSMDVDEQVVTAFFQEVTHDLSQNQEPANRFDSTDVQSFHDKLFSSSTSSRRPRGDNEE